MIEKETPENYTQLLFSKTKKTNERTKIRLSKAVGGLPFGSLHYFHKNHSKSEFELGFIYHINIKTKSNKYRPSASLLPPATKEQENCPAPCQANRTIQTSRQCCHSCVVNHIRQSCCGFWVAWILLMQIWLSVIRSLSFFVTLFFQPCFLLLDLRFIIYLKKNLVQFCGWIRFLLSDFCAG